MTNTEEELGLRFVTISRPGHYIHETLASLGISSHVTLVVGSTDIEYLDRYREHSQIAIDVPTEDESAAWELRPVHHRASWNFWRALQGTHERSRLLLCEDDILFARGWQSYLRKVIERIEQSETDYILTLYSPGPLPPSSEGRYVAIDPDLFFGHQGILYAGRVAQEFREYLFRHGVDCWERPQDLNLAHFAREAGIPMYATSPSLIQHIGRETTGQGWFHEAPSFMPDVRSLVSTEHIDLTWEEIDGWFDFDELYRSVVRDARPGAQLVEVGCWLGRSAAFLGQEILRSGKPLSLFAIEHGIGGDTLAQPTCGTIAPKLVHNLFRCGLQDVVTPIITSSLRAAVLFADASLDFVFIDANHSYEAVINDIRAWWPKIRPGGLLAGHDYSWTGVARAVHEFFGRTDLRIPHNINCWGVMKSHDSPHSLTACLGGSDK